MEKPKQAQQMEKYGVAESDERIKQASSGTAKPVCPKCGRKAEEHGNVIKCPVHGTEPFEF